MARVLLALAALAAFAGGCRTDTPQPAAVPSQSAATLAGEPAALVFVAPSTKTIWPLIWYTDDAALVLARERLKTLFPDWDFPNHPVTERTSAPLLLDFLKAARGAGQVSEADRPLILIFVDAQNNSETLIISARDVAGIAQKHSAEMPPSSYLTTILKRTGAIPVS